MSSETDNNEPQMDEEEFKAEVAKSKEFSKRLKKTLKMRSKSQLIDVIIHYASELEELRFVSKLLLEENKELKGESNEKK